jgi:hypothetical protein
MLNLIKKLVSTITFGKVALWVIAILLSGVSFTVYENRNRIFANITESVVTNQVGLTFVTSQETEAMIKTQVLADRAIIGIVVMSADLRLNEAKSIYFFGDDPILIQVDAESKKASNNRLPLFANLDDSNADMIKLINGQFTCTKFSDTLLSRIYPELNSSVKMMCRASIPSYYGYFSGFVGVFLGENLSPEKLAQLKVITDKIATEIYFRDVIPTQKLEGAAGNRKPLLGQ